MTASAPSRSAVVVGAGIVGVCSALYLQRDGWAVTLVDPDPPGDGCSFGNAGLIASAAVMPVATPGVLADVPRMLTDPLSPLTIRWSYLPRLLPWLIGFLRASTPARVEEISVALASITTRVFDDFAPLVQQSGAGDLMIRRGYIGAYRNPAKLAGMRADIAMRRRRGVRVEELGPDELRQLEPALARDVVGGYHLPETGHTVNPLALTQRLAADFQSRGGAIRRARVIDFTDITDAGPRAVMTDGGPIACDLVVIAAGAYSRALAAKLGADVPLDTERGYHTVLPRPGLELRLPVMSGDGGFAITPMSDGIRLAGTVEFGGVDAAPDYRRIAPLIAQAKALLPGLDTRGGSQWMGRRPSMPDSLPVIGRSPRHRNALLAFGHGHLGLTLSATTGRLIADLAGDRAPAVDLAPFRPERFSGARF
jgi:D-amino-acid dehydrogenase